MEASEEDWIDLALLLLSDSTRKLSVFHQFPVHPSHICFHCYLHFFWMFLWVVMLCNNLPVIFFFFSHFCSVPLCETVETRFFLNSLEFFGIFACVSFRSVLTCGLSSLLKPHAFHPKLKAKQALEYINKIRDDWNSTGEIPQ